MDKRQTSTQRLYSDTTGFIQDVVKRGKPGTTFADVVEDWAKRLYPNAYEAWISSKETVDEAFEQDQPEKQAAPAA